MEEYTVRYLKADGALALVYLTTCVNDQHAHDTAVKMFSPDYAKLEVWRGPSFVENFQPPASHE